MTKPIQLPELDLELERRTYNVTMNGNKLSFQVYGEEDDLDTLEMLIGYLAKVAAGGLNKEDDDE